MAKQKTDTEGVPVRLDSAPDHREGGVPVAIPDAPPATSSGTKTGQSASTQKKG